MKNVNIGIDLGTTNSLIAKYIDGKVQVFKNPIGFKETLPSVVAFRPERVLIGDKAREYVSKDAINVFSNFKRKMGTDEKYYVVNIDENITPIELSAYILRELKNFIIGQENIEACVITIPASFDSMQSNATLKAGEQAGIDQVFLLQEPIAASLAYFNAQQHGTVQEGHWLVYDFGGGTFDAALVNISADDMKVIDNEGNNFLGGVDLDFAIVQKIIVPQIISKTGALNFESELREKHGKYEKIYYHLLYLAEEAKKELSNATQTEIEFSATINEQEYEFCISITKQDLDLIFLPRVQETIDLIKKLLVNNNLQESDIQQIIMVGGSTYLPLVREQLASQLQIKLNTNIDPSTAIAVGAAHYAASKFYKPKNVNAHADSILQQVFEKENNIDQAIKIQCAYNHASRDAEEILIMNCVGENITSYSYRIIRSDGGFDTGLVALKEKKTEFLNLLSNQNNNFILKIFDHSGKEIPALQQQINITHGKYTIDGQPLPHDISIEVDDIENKTTKLEIIFERNSLLPQKRTLYREVSKTIKKGSDEKIIISILEGNRNARPSSNLCIGCIEISGKQLDFDLIRGSDIEIQLQIDESRILDTKVYLVMTKQEFKNVFSVSEKVISLSRLKEQCFQLEADLKNNLQEYQYFDNTTLTIQTENLLKGVHECLEQLQHLKEKDSSDTKYIVAEKIWRYSQEADQMGGNDRIATLVERYLENKDYVQQTIEAADFDKDKLRAEYQRLEKNEAVWLNTKNASVLENAIKQLDEVYNWALANNIGFLVSRFAEFKTYDKDDYTDYNLAKKLISLCDEKLQDEKYFEFRQHIYALSKLIVQFDEHNKHLDFKGTGIG